MTAKIGQSPKVGLFPEAEAAQGKKARKVRHQLESLHTVSAPAAVDKIWPYLTSDDRFLRSACACCFRVSTGRFMEQASSERNGCKYEASGVIGFGAFGT